MEQKYKRQYRQLSDETKQKLVTDIEDIKILDEDQFKITYMDNHITSMKFYQETPYLLNI